MSAAEGSTDEAQAARLGSVALLGATVFLSAFLLFQVQPIIGKFILPWFGSTPGVWATALLFFQLMLLGGYAYAHFIVSRLTWRRQAILHSVLLGLALTVLPITPDDALKPASADAPVARILLILTVSVGVPYLLLAATAPLIQRWFAHLHPGRSPYRLYALSNLGSLLALLSYPFLVEPYVRLRSQTASWSLAYVGFAALCAGCAWMLYRSLRRTGLHAASADGPRVSAGMHDRPRPGSAVLWLLLSACGSGLLLATTNLMSTDIAVVPFLWILPLCVYLLTFILTFDHERWYVRPLFISLLPLALINAVRLLYGGGRPGHRGSGGRLLVDAFRPLHVLPRGAVAVAPYGAPSHALLSDGIDGRSDGRLTGCDRRSGRVFRHVRVPLPAGRVLSAHGLRPRSTLHAG